MQTLFVEPMTSRDLPEVMAIEVVSFSAPWPEEAYRHEIETNPMASYFVARLEPEPTSPVVGYGGMWFQYDEAHVTTLAVQPRLRGRGIGERLLLHLMMHAMERNMAFVTLEVRVSNDVARRLYGRCGFATTGYRRRYYSDNGEDALIMATPRFDDPVWRSALLRMWHGAEPGVRSGAEGNGIEPGSTLE